MKRKFKQWWLTRRVLRYQRGNENLYIEEEQTTQWPKEEEQTTQWPKEEQITQWPKEEEQTTQWPKEEQTTQWPKEKGNKDKQRSTKHTHTTKDRVTWTPLKTGGEFMCSGRLTSSCSTSGTRRVNLVTNPVINHEWVKDREVLTTSGTHPWSFVVQIFRSGECHGGDRKAFEVMTST